MYLCTFFLFVCFICFLLGFFFMQQIPVILIILMISEHPWRTMVGNRDHDNGGLRRHGAQDIRRHVRRCPVCTCGCPHYLAARPRYRIQLLHVLQPHSGLSSFYVVYSTSRVSCIDHFFLECFFRVRGSTPLSTLQIASTIIDPFSTRIVYYF